MRQHVDGEIACDWPRTTRAEGRKELERQSHQPHVRQKCHARRTTLVGAGEEPVERCADRRRRQGRPKEPVHILHDRQKFRLHRVRACVRPVHGDTERSIRAAGEHAAEPCRRRGRSSSVAFVDTLLSRRRWAWVAKQVTHCLAVVEVTFLARLVGVPQKQPSQARVPVRCPLAQRQERRPFARAEALPPNGRHGLARRRPLLALRRGTPVLRCIARCQRAVGDHRHVQRIALG
mmetsp:Transcript_4626/g.9932  ORF Transcript_4626/g.9932 Transcript_4626/m.9932 type:complete len:234 (-) Transcript_4626:7009-7710(-)